MRLSFLARTLRCIAAILRRAAALLENLGKSVPADPAMAELAARFPGAPEHWLQYIAARAPHLAETRFVPLAPDGRQHAATPHQTEPSLHLLPHPARQPSRPPIFVKSAPQTIVAAYPAIRGKIKAVRPYLRLLPSHLNHERDAPGSFAAEPFGEHRVRHETSNCSNASICDEQRTEAAIGPAPPQMRHGADLHIVAARDNVMAPSPAHDRVTARVDTALPIWTARRGVLAHLLRSTERSEAPLSNGLDASTQLAMTFEHATAAVMPLDRAAIENLREKPDLPHALTAPQDTMPAPDTYVSYQRAHLHNACRIESDGARLPWPALPLACETAPDAPIEPPRLKRLSCEQEEGLWSA